MFFFGGGGERRKPNFAKLMRNRFCQVINIFENYEQKNQCLQNSVNAFEVWPTASLKLPTEEYFETDKKEIKSQRF